MGDFMTHDLLKHKQLCTPTRNEHGIVKHILGHI